MCRSSTSTVNGLVEGVAAWASLPAIALLGPPEEQEREGHQADRPRDREHPGVARRVMAAEKRLPVDGDVHVERVQLHEAEQPLVAMEPVDVVEDAGQV